MDNKELVLMTIANVIISAFVSALVSFWATSF